MIGWSGLLMMGLGLIHMAVLGLEASPYFPGWARLELWTLGHWQPIAAQDTALLASNMAFWSTLGSGAIPMMILGFVLLWLARRGITPPVALGWAFVIWQLLATLVIEPSGFGVGLAIGLLLLVGVYRERAPA